jgi:hypothetical protein
METWNVFFSLQRETAILQVVLALTMSFHIQHKITFSISLPKPVIQLLEMPRLLGDKFSCTAKPSILSSYNLLPNSGILF